MTLAKTKQLNSENEYAKRNTLSLMVCERLDDLFEKLEIRVRRAGKLYMGTCPIHQGDNATALNIYPEGFKSPGSWLCNTHKCEDTFKKTIIGFTRGVLSTKYYGWTEKKPNANQAPFDKVIKWLCKFVEQDWQKIKIDESLTERNKFVSQVETFKKLNTQRRQGPPRELVIKSLDIPATYYLNRGYKEETLVEYDVGLCKQINKPMSNRVVVPIYDANGKYMVGCTGRSIFECCKKCKMYHESKIACPSVYTEQYCKWKQTEGITNYLYNWWNAAKYIQEKGFAIVVESPGNVWRLVEAGINNVVATFGTKITDAQQILLEKLGIMKLCFILDNDEAGTNYRKSVAEQLPYYLLKFIVPTTKDVGEMSVEQVKSEIIPQLY